VQAECNLFETTSWYKKRMPDEASGNHGERQKKVVNLLWRQLIILEMTLRAFSDHRPPTTDNCLLTTGN
jgi:hypothetical protein